ncbi:NAD-dependent protein deacetylase sirtuin-7, partial [Schistosoma japonicum]
QNIFVGIIFPCYIPCNAVVFCVANLIVSYCTNYFMPANNNDEHNSAHSSVVNVLFFRTLGQRFTLSYLYFDNDDEILSELAFPQHLDKFAAQDWHHDAAILARLIKDSKGSIVIYTGAGISTSACIPDYRGTRGLWTVQSDKTASLNSVSSTIGFNKRNRYRRTEVSKLQCKSRFKSSKASKNISLKLRLPEATVAKPTFTHMAIKVLVDEGYVRHVVSQNVDGLHVRSGLKREKLSELHGNLFIEQCIACEHAVFRTFDVAETTSRSHHFTGRICPRCRDLYPTESLIASNILKKTAEQLAVSKCKTTLTSENLVLSYRHAAKKLVRSFENICLNAVEHLHNTKNSEIPINFQILKKAPLLRDVVVHFFERQPEMGLAEIYRIKPAIEAVHGRKVLQLAISSTTKDCKPLVCGCKRPNEESTKYIIGSSWFKKVRPAMKVESTDLCTASEAVDAKSVSPDPANAPAKLIVVVGSSLTVLRNYSFLWPYGLGRCVQESSSSRRQKKTQAVNSDSSTNCRLVIINLQPTCKDGVADLVLRVPCDDLFRIVMSDHLGIDVPQYNYKDDPLYSIGLSLSPEEECTRTRPNIPFSSI